MTDQRTFSDVRTTRTRATRAWSNNQGYTVSVDRFAFPGDPENVHWLTTEPDDKRIRTWTRHGILLRGYRVTKDNHPDWSAELELAPGSDGQMQLVAAYVTGDGLASTMVPVVAVLQACLRVGGVVERGERVARSVEREDGTTFTATFTNTRTGAPPRDATSDLFSDDQVHDLTGERPFRPRGYRQDPDLLRRVWDAVCEHDRQRDARLAGGLAVRRTKDFPSQRAFVAAQCGLPLSNVQKQITEARRKYGNANKGENK